MNQKRPLDLALEYMEIVYGERQLEDLYHLLTPDCSFHGPLFQFDTAEGYIKSMLDAPPEDFEYKLRHSFEDANVACLVYDFFKPGIRAPMVQIFETRDGRISKITLIFDTAPFN
ncbi:MAG: nuclear transport factor 2 family protein [Chloroflexi bacterium]|nr:MAG: nuclear transport factor 2 family protein [Chloroflexota bacterium]MBL1194318.1 nuclear transport factor 2 family protein [Chloroflexota bacterium]NOH11608.1 nuclear transport factor 2 family protein [Chloroflexota bacterium]